MVTESGRYGVVRQERRSWRSSVMVTDRQPTAPVNDQNREGNNPNCWSGSRPVLHACRMGTPPGDVDIVAT